jgi:hypothetical protein
LIDYFVRNFNSYTKIGVSSKVRELKSDIEEGKEIDGELYPVHVLTSVFKSFLRELPEPLLTFDLYEEFLRAAGNRIVMFSPEHILSNQNCA